MQTPVDYSVLPRHYRKAYRHQVESVFDHCLRTAFTPDLVGRARQLAAEESPRGRDEAFAAIAEVARRTLGLTAFPVQILGGLVIADGNIAEMRTGEGKTLTAAITATWMALKGQQVHVMTANSYLAGRDAAWATPLYEAFDLSVGVVDDDSSPVDRQVAYRADIVFGTAARFVFDWLEDRMVYNEAAIVQARGHDFVLIDEADALLIDEARTPFIISGKADWSLGAVEECAAWVANLDTDMVELVVDERTVTLTDAGMDKASADLGLSPDGSDINAWSVMRAALKARFLFRIDVDYAVTDLGAGPAAVIIDKATGRFQPTMRFQDGLHEAIEAKEGLEVQAPTVTQASVTLASYLRNYQGVAGMTGTAVTSEDEFAHLYGLHVIPVPTNRPVVRVDHPDFISQTEAAKFEALLDDVLTRHEAGQPILLGAPTDADAEHIGALLVDAGVPHAILSATNHTNEADLIAQAGRLGAVTIATNMAGRGVDISLGGEGATDDEREAVIALGGLCVLSTARHDSRRIDDQLRGRSGRQGEPGESRFYLSAEDELVSMNCPPQMVARLEQLSGFAAGSKQAAKMLAKVISQAQTTADGRAESARASVRQYDQVIESQRDELYRMRTDLLEADLDSLVALWTTQAQQFGAGTQALTADLVRANSPGAPEMLLAGVLRQLLLSRLDAAWSRYLESLAALRDGISLRAAGQQNAESAWTQEAHVMFVEMLEDVLATGCSLLENLQIAPQAT